MLISIPWDIAGPGLLSPSADIGLPVFCLSVLIIIGIESLALLQLKWGTFKRAVLCSIVMNLVTFVIGIGVVPFTLEMGLWGLLIDFVISVCIEFIILMTFKRGAMRENWNAALTANAASYLLVILPLYLYFGLLK
jgi:hypothetical protein